MDIETLRRAAAVSPDNLPLQLLLGNALLEQFELEEAHLKFEQVLAVDPINPQAASGMAHVLELEGKTSEAIVRLEHLLGTFPDFAKGWNQLARLELGDGQISAAQEHYRRSVSLDPSMKDPELQRRIDGTILDPSEPISDLPVDTGGWGVGALRDPDLDSIAGEFSRLDLEDPLQFDFLRMGDTIGFSQVGGMGQVKDEIRMRILHPLRHRDLFAAYGKKAGGGVLLYGPPGCGKTLISQATAGEFQANFFFVGLHQVLDMWIGGSEARLHGIFSMARKYAPSVLFFDEVDALASDRKDLRASAARTLISQFLAELDGSIGSNDNVLILAATNVPWHLDPAFLRPGRFDRVVFVPPPDLEARREIVEIHAKDKPVDRLNARQVAKAMKNFSGADIKATFDRATEAALGEAIRRGKIVPLTSNSLVSAAKRVKPSTPGWLESARNYALRANQSGFYDDVLKFLGIRR